MRRSSGARLISCWLLVALSPAIATARPAPPPAGPAAAAGTTALDTEYRLGAGDHVRIDVYNEDTMSGEYEIDGSGTISLQLIGPIRAAGKSVPELTAAIADRLKQGYLLNPSVAIQVLTYRPFYVLGEVKQPGKYPYVSQMTVLNAIVLAGGYTYRGKRSYAMVTHAADPTKTEQPLKPTDLVAPGDIIRVPERIF